MQKKLVIVAVVVAAVFFTACKKDNLSDRSGQKEVETEDFISYPPTGEDGEDNILAESITSINANDGNTIYSMTADVPKDMSLKIILRGKEWFYSLGSDYNLKISDFKYGENGEANYQVFTVREAGKSCDLRLIFHKTGMLPEPENITIEYYENGAETPTKIKNVQIIY